ncbi:hypothetical protein GIB67_043070 [Kingdonia uniflora]|uniref:Uncharacterized protein n=1 Tax=Kingdonia uniflora TaxID=39325 RepID=A0A7J7M9V6_9MAGN|nr:hypothetical protein GIB67_043070 [Kingdonia uniflora]
MSLGYCKKNGTKRLRDTLKYNMWCNDGKVFLPRRYDTSDRFKQTDGSAQESRTAYRKTPNRQRFGEKCISTPSPPSRNTENQKKKRRVRERKISTDDSINTEGGKDKKKAVIKSLNCKLREEVDIEEVLKKLHKLSKLVRTNAADSHSGVDDGAASGSEKRITAKDFLEYYAVKYATATNGAYLYSSSVRPCFFDLSLAGRVWNDNLLWVSGECLQQSHEEPLEIINRTITKGINYKVSRKESFIDVIAMEGTELKAVLKELEISRFKRVASKDDKVRRSQAKRRLVGKTPGSIEEKLTTSELNIPLKLARLNEISDGPQDMSTVSSTVVRNLAKRKAVKWGVTPRSLSSVSVNDSSKRRKVIYPTTSQEMLEESDKFVKGADLRPRFKVEADLLEEHCRAKAREKMVAITDDEFKRQVRAKSEAEAEGLVTASAISQNNFTGKLYQLRYMKAEIAAFSEGNYEKIKIMDEEEVEEREGGLNTAEKTDADNQETINQEIENSRLRVVDLEGLLEVEKKSSAELQYGDLLDDNVKLSLKLEEAKRQVEEKTATILSRDFSLNQLTSKLDELKEFTASGSRHEAELAEYHIRALNEEISDIKCNIRALNELLLKREIDLDTVRAN